MQLGYWQVIQLSIFKITVNQVKLHCKKYLHILGSFFALLVVFFRKKQAFSNLTCHLPKERHGSDMVYHFWPMLVEIFFSHLIYNTSNFFFTIQVFPFSFNLPLIIWHFRFAGLCFIYSFVSSRMLFYFYLLILYHISSNKCPCCLLNFERWLKRRLLGMRGQPFPGGLQFLHKNKILMTKKVYEQKCFLFYN